jgi:undecaprenyl-diphosphatase
MSTLTWAEAAVIGLVQGVSELFPVSSLGHSVLIPALVGGSWARDLSVSRADSPYLAFIVGLHVATAIALVIFFRRDWVRIVRGLVSSIRYRRVVDSDQRLAWMIVLATIPVGLVGIVAEKPIRTVFARPEPAAAFLVLNGVVLYVAERMRRRTAAAGDRAAGELALDPGSATSDAAAIASDARLSQVGYARGVLIGAAQILALAAGISRSGVTMVAGMARGLSHEDAARFSFLLATPVILAAGVLKLPTLAGPLGDGIRPQVLLGSVLSGLGAYVSVRFLVRWFTTRTLTPFAIYCVVVGGGSLIVFAAR